MHPLPLWSSVGEEEPDIKGGESPTRLSDTRAALICSETLSAFHWVFLLTSSRNH